MHRDSKLQTVKLMVSLPTQLGTIFYVWNLAFTSFNSGQRIAHERLIRENVPHTGSRHMKQPTDPSFSEGCFTPL